MKQSKSFRMDEQVVYTMAAVCLLAIIFLAFRFASNSSGTTINIIVPSDTVLVNEQVKLKVHGKTGKTYLWNFGDNNEQQDTDSVIDHKYTKTGIYTVKVVVDDNSEDFETLYVCEPKPVVEISYDPVLVYPETAKVGESVSFSDASVKSVSWEWYIEDVTQVYTRSRDVKYTFKTPGLKTFVLKTNIGSRHESTQKRFITILTKESEDDANTKNDGGSQKPTTKIILHDKPPSRPLTIDNNNNHNAAPAPIPTPVTPPKNEEPKGPVGKEISDAQLKAELFKVAQGEKSAGDFSAYFCGNDIAIIRGKNTIPFSEFCKELKKHKKKLKDIILLKREETSGHCLRGLTINLKVCYGLFCDKTEIL